MTCFSSDQKLIWFLLVFVFVSALYGDVAGIEMTCGYSCLLLGYSWQKYVKQRNKVWK